VKTYKVVFSPEARFQLAKLYRYIAAAVSPQVAAGYTDGIVTHCENLSTFPMRGTMRDDIRPGLRIINYRKRVVIAFSLEDDTVSIIGVFYGGQDYEAALRDDEL
jgi:plasmid stabilization system protein ParE